MIQKMDYYVIVYYIAWLLQFALTFQTLAVLAYFTHIRLFEFVQGRVLYRLITGLYDEEVKPSRLLKRLLFYFIILFLFFTIFVYPEYKRRNELSKELEEQVKQTKQAIQEMKKLAEELNKLGEEQDKLGEEIKTQCNNLEEEERDLCLERKTKRLEELYAVLKQMKHKIAAYKCGSEAKQVQIKDREIPNKKATKSNEIGANETIAESKIGKKNYCSTTKDMIHDQVNVYNNIPFLLGFQVPFLFW